MESGRRALHLALIAMVALVLYVPGLGRPALWEPDEGRYAEIAREMYLSGDWVTPRNDWVRYFEKPPLVYWFEAGSIALFGANEFAVRLPAALFSAGSVVIAFALARAMMGAEAALLSALALALSPLFFGFARFATLDPPLAFFITAGLSAFYLAARSGDFASAAARRYFVLAAAMLALGTLAKGPVALLLGGAVSLMWIVWERRTAEIRRMAWLEGVLVYLAIAAPWFALAEKRNPGFLRFFFVHEHFWRYVANNEHVWGPWFFVPVILAGAWPWMFFVPFGTSALGRNPRLRTALSFLVVWFLVFFLFFSIPRSKLGSYVLPALPPVAIAAGYGMAQLWRLEAQRVRRILGWFCTVNLVVAIAGAGALALAHQRLPGTLVRDGLAIAALLAVSAIACFALGRDGRHPGTSVAVIVAGVLLAMGTAVRAREDAHPLVTYRTLARGAARYLEPGCMLLSYRHNVQSLPFYTGARTALVSYRGELDEPFAETPDAAASFIASDRELAALWSSGKCMMLVANRGDLEVLAKILIPRPVITGCEGKKVVLYQGPRAQQASNCGRLRP